MKKLAVLSAASALSFAMPAHAAFYLDQASFQAAVPSATLLEDFESVVGAQLDTPLPSLSRASGTYTGLAGTPFPNVFVSSAGYTNYGAGNNPTPSKILTANGDESFNVVLSHATSALGMNVYLNDLGDASVLMFDEADAFVGSITYFTASDNVRFFGFTTEPGQKVKRFTFVSTLGGQVNTGIDNIYAVADTPAVPEPATWALMLAGFGAMGVALRRRRNVAVSFA